MWKKLILQVKSWQSLKMTSNFIVKWDMKSLDKGQEKERAERKKGCEEHGGLFKDIVENQREQGIEKTVSSTEDQTEVGDHNIVWQYI